MPQPHTATDALASRAREIYEREVRPKLSASDTGKFLVLDVGTGAYEIDADDLIASERARARFPNARLFTLRVGYPTAYRIGRTADLEGAA